MASSQFGMSERNAALVKKFQGNGWAVTCSTSSQRELSATIGLAASVVKEPSEAPDPPELRLIHYQSDWADTVLERSLYWQPDNATAPLWVIKATENWDFALFQLPAPDRRWIVKFAGRILEPFSHRFLGWADLHEIIAHGFLLDQSMLVDGQSSLADLRKRKVDLLRNAELIGEHKSQNQEPDVRCNVSGTKLHGLETQTREGKISLDRWRSCADDFNRLLQKRLDRVFQAIRKVDHIAGSAIKKAVHFVNGHWSFSDSALWMTRLKEDLPYDAKMVLNGNDWEIDFPDSNELLIVPDSTGMRAIARVLMCNNIPCPCALAADGALLTEFLSRPRHHKYFEATYRRPRVECGDPANSEVERAICTAMHFKPGWYYKADHVISENSELHTVCGLPKGRVTLRRAEALEGVRDLVKRQQARLFFCSPPTEQFKRILSDIEAGIEFARKQEKLLEQVQPKSEEYQERVQKAIYRAKKELEKMGDWMTRYDRLADHFFESIKGGLVLQYTGPYRWKVEGLPQTPDTLDLAEDHRAFKRTKAAKAIRKAKAKMKANHSLNRVSRSAACGKA
jgi:hypothetical protein